MSDTDYDENNDTASASSLSSYAAHRISRRDALRKIGLAVGGLSLLGYEFLYPSKAIGNELEALDDPNQNQENTSSESSWYVPGYYSYYYVTSYYSIYSLYSYYYYVS